MYSLITQVHRDERGMLTMVNTITVTACTLMIVFIINVGHVADEKIEMQNAADAAGVTGTTIMARGMNAVTATNHVIGEMTGMVIVHHAVGGHNLDNDETGDTQSIDAQLDAAHKAYLAAGGSQDIAYDTVREQDGVQASDGSAEMESKKRLKELLTYVYWSKTAAEIMKKIPYTRPAGEALHAAMHALEIVIKMEYEALNVLHEMARALVPAKLLLRDVMMPAAKQYTEQVVRLTPDLALEAAEKVGELAGCETTLYPNPPPLPLVIDPHAKASSLVRPTDQPVAESCAGCKQCGSVESGIDRDQIVKITQLARASFPWVAYHRQPILDLMGPLLPLSQGKKHYKDASDGASKDVCSEVQLEWQDMGLFVLRDYPSPDKGYAAWTEDADKAEALFSVVGLAQRPAPAVYGVGVFRQQHAEGRLTYAQTLLYNANPQQRPKHKIDLSCKRITPNRQARVGWDTLNWSPDSDPPFELVAKTDSGGAPTPQYPAIKINWQAKLIPASDSRISQMLSERSSLPGRFTSVLDRMVSKLRPALQTH